MDNEIKTIFVIKTKIKYMGKFSVSLWRLIHPHLISPCDFVRAAKSGLLMNTAAF